MIFKLHWRTDGPCTLSWTDNEGDLQTSQWEHKTCLEAFSEHSWMPVGLSTYSIDKWLKRAKND